MYGFFTVIKCRYIGNAVRIIPHFTLLATNANIIVF